MANDCNFFQYPQLNKKYMLIAFDWDGTAVVNRQSSAKQFINTVIPLLQKNIKICIVTGTNFQNIDRQFSSQFHSEYKKNLFILTNRGSEVFTFEGSAPVLLHSLEATQEQNRQLDIIAQDTKKQLEEFQFNNINIIYNRLNRRKIDLYPEWNDPPKNEIDILLEKVTEKIRASRFPGNLRDIFKLIQENAAKAGLFNAKVTSDVKHLEVGLTDKRDAIVWIMENIARPNNIQNNEILIGGDEFGEIGGFSGSDYKMFLEEETDITYFSVGIEPNGTPEGIINLGGGPECFCRVIENQSKY